MSIFIVGFKNFFLKVGKYTSFLGTHIFFHWTFKKKNYDALGIKVGRLTILKKSKIFPKYFKIFSCELDHVYNSSFDSFNID
jgi:hypothetical protein